MTRASELRDLTDDELEHRLGERRQELFNLRFQSVTQKPAETRMGSGKGSPEHWVAVVKPGRVMFELAGVPEPLAREAMRLAGHKLPVRTKFVTREDGEG